MIVWVLVFHGTNVFAQAQKVTRFRDTYEIDEVGDARITRKLQLSSRKFAEVQQRGLDPVEVIKSVSAAQDWHEIKVVDGRFESQTKCVVVELIHRGFVKTLGDGRWEMKSRAKPGVLELITCRPDRVILHGSDTTPWGPVSATFHVKPPENAKSIIYDQNRAALRYQLEPAIRSEAQAKSDVSLADDWKIETVPQLMAGLAKVYSQESIDDLWTARSVFHNNGSSKLVDFRVRFKIDGFSTWGQWHRTPVVYPDQSVVNGYFPVLDIEAMALLKSRRTTEVAVQIQYETSALEKVTCTRTAKIDILPHTEVVYRRDPVQESENWQEQNELLPALVTSYCSYNDAVIQQLAGRLSAMANGPASSLSDRDAARYLLSVHKFLQDNHFRFGPSTRLSRESQFDPWIQYPRTYLQTRASNELDMAIFWATIVKAVGLKAEIVVNPKTAIAVVYLPSGQQIPIVGTDIDNRTLDEVVNVAQTKLKQTQNLPQFVISLDEMEELGFRPLELESLPGDFLDRQSFKFEKLPEPKQEPNGN